MKTQRRYKPSFQRRYKLWRVVLGNIHRVLYSLQGFFFLVNIVMALIIGGIQNLVFFLSASRN